MYINLLLIIKYRKDQQQQISSSPSSYRSYTDQRKKLMCSALNMDSLVMFEMPAASSMVGRLNLGEYD
jgi:hypothetical protein